MQRAGWIAVAAGCLVVVVAIWFWWLPSLVISEIGARLQARGIESDVRGARLRVGSVRLDGLRARSGSAGLTIEAREVVVDASLWQLLRGNAGRGGIEVRGMKLHVDLHAPFMRDLIVARGKKKASEGPGEARPLPELHVFESELSVADAAGKLLFARGLRMDLAEGVWSVAGDSLQIGATPGEVITLQNASAEGKVDGRRPVLHKAQAESALLQWAAEAAPGVVSDAFPAASGRTVARLRAALQTLRGSAVERGSEPAAKSALWAPDAQVTISKVHVVRGAGAQQEKLASFSLLLNAEADHALRARVRGQAAGDGEIDLDVRLWPRAARVEGRVKLDDVSLALFAPALPPLPFFQLDRTRVHAQLSLKGQGLEAMAATGEVSIRDLAFASEGLAKLPVGPVSVVARGDGTWTPARRELQIAHADIEVLGLRASAMGVLAWPAGSYRVDSKVELKKGSCRHVLEAVPVGLLDELSTVELSGDFAAQVAVHVDSAHLDATKIDFDVQDGCRFGALPPILDLTRFMQPFTHRVLEPEGEIFEFETGPGSAAWTPIELISPFMLQAAVAHEDGRFFTHHGFAESEIAAALSRNLKARAFRFGASTITMQLVKNVFLHRDKLLSRKVQEAFITWWLEQHWDKRHILELYLNVIEYGPGLYGIRNAAWHYFGTIPMNLTPAQSAFLASILPSPKSMHSYYDKGALSASMKSRMGSFLRHMRARDRIDGEALAFGLEELNNFRFYRPDQPPPVPPVIRGSAASPPFDVPVNANDAWDTFEGTQQVPDEDGSYGP